MKEMLLYVNFRETQGFLHDLEKSLLNTCEDIN